MSSCGEHNQSSCGDQDKYFEEFLRLSDSLKFYSWRFSLGENYFYVDVGAFDSNHAKKRARKGLNDMKKKSKQIQFLLERKKFINCQLEQQTILKENMVKIQKNEELMREYETERNNYKTEDARYEKQISSIENEIKSSEIMSDGYEKYKQLREDGKGEKIDSPHLYIYENITRLNAACYEQYKQTIYYSRMISKLEENIRNLGTRKIVEEMILSDSEKSKLCDELSNVIDEIMIMCADTEFDDFIPLSHNSEIFNILGSKLDDTKLVEEILSVEPIVRNYKTMRFRIVP